LQRKKVCVNILEIKTI